MVRHLPLIAVLLVYVVFATAGINWGLPSRDVDRYLFGGDEPWTGQRIHELANAARRDSDARGADVDADPLDKTRYPVPLNDTDQKAAAIYLRYRLFTHQPDEMITMMALSRMRPGEFDFDPGLYQYGGVFIYPVGAVIKLCGVVGLIDARSDLVYYLDHPAEFGKFYIAARAYVAAWGLIGVLAVYSIARRLKDHATGLVAALLCAVLPVVVCMSHEAKPHLPGAVLMLVAVLLAMRYIDRDKRRDLWLLCVACGAALGMVLSSLPVLVLIPFVEWLRVQRDRAGLGSAVGRAAAGAGIALAVYLVTNPYVPINLVANQDVLRSNFGNSLAMYEVSRIGEGLARMIELTAEGASWLVLVFGCIGAGLLIKQRRVGALPLAVVGGLIFVQFVLLGAGKPAEYGRFGVFTNVALAVATACVLTHPWSRARGLGRAIPAVLTALWVGWLGYQYLGNFVADASRDNSRVQAAATLAGQGSPVALLAEPAPYSCPPLDFSKRPIWLVESADAWRRRCEQASPAEGQPGPRILIAMADGPTPISWADKPIRHQTAPRARPTSD